MQHVHVIVQNIAGHDVTARVDARGDVWMVIGDDTTGERFDHALELVAPGRHLLDGAWCFIDGPSGRVLDRAA